MPALASTSTDLWTDKFRTPTFDQLCQDYPASVRNLVDHARESLGDLKWSKERLVWKGLPWRWCLTFECRGARPALAYLVPSPEDPIIAAPLTHEDIEAIAGAKPSRHVREGIILGTEVAGLRWSEWTIQSENQLQDVLSIIRLRHERAIG